MAKTIAKGMITITLKSKPTRKEIKARKQVAQGKERALKAKIRSMAQQAKSQLKGLENAGINSPAATKLLSKTDLKTKGKSYNQLQSTYFALDSFLKSQTASVKGATENLNQIANLVGMKNATAQEIAQYASQFFQIASYAKQALKTSGQNVGSTRLFEAIRRVTQENQAKWDSATDTFSKVESVLNSLQEQQAEIAQDEFAEYIIDVTGVSD